MDVNIYVYVYTFLHTHTNNMGHSPFMPLSLKLTDKEHDEFPIWFFIYMYNIDFNEKQHIDMRNSQNSFWKWQMKMLRMNNCSDNSFIHFIPKQFYSATINFF